MPLAVCNKRTVGTCGELVDAMSQVKGGKITAISAMHNPAHKWSYYPDMRKNEVLLFKTYDSEDVKSRGQLHTAFQPHDTSTSGGEILPPRHSCEVRVLCLLPKEEEPTLQREAALSP